MYKIVFWKIGSFVQFRELLPVFFCLYANIEKEQSYFRRFPKFFLELLLLYNSLRKSIAFRVKCNGFLSEVVEQMSPLPRLNYTTARARSRISPSRGLTEM